MINLSLITPIVFELARQYKGEDITIKDLIGAVQYLYKYGYINPKFLDGKTADTIREIVKSISLFHEFMNRGTGDKINHKTLGLMNEHRCGVPDILRNEKGDIIPEEARWRKTHLKYCIVGWVGDDINQSKQKELMRKSYDQISAAAKITFEEVNNPNQADIVIDTGKGKTNNFDGPGGTLAWAYLPNGSDNQLSMKFDVDEYWTYKGAPGRGIYFLNVACHESLHNCGLGHTNVPNSLMNPYYSPSIDTLQADDVKRMVALYGNPTPNPNPNPNPTPTPQPDPNRMTIIVEGKITIPGYRITKLA